MTAASDLEAAPPLLRAHIRPNRSLGRQRQIIAVAAFALASLVVAVVFLAHGYWPVTPFLGLDVVLMALAFRWVRRAGRAYEDIVVQADVIVIRRADARSRVEEERIPTAWTRLEREDDPDFGCQALRLRHRRRSAVVAAMLSPAERERFAPILVDALSRARQGGLAALSPGPISVFESARFRSPQ